MHNTFLQLLSSYPSKLLAKRICCCIFPCIHQDNISINTEASIDAIQRSDVAITTANNAAIEVAKFREDFDHKLSEQKKLNDVEKQLLHQK